MSLILNRLHVIYTICFEQKALGLILRYHYASLTQVTSCYTIASINGCHSNKISVGAASSIPLDDISFLDTKMTH